MKKISLLLMIALLMLITTAVHASASEPVTMEVGPFEFSTEVCFSAAGERFEKGSVNEGLYNAIKGLFEDVAAGRVETSVLKLRGQQIPRGLSWSEEELGVTIVKNNSITDAAQEAFSEKLNEVIDLNKIVLAVLADCPYEQFWYDKSIGVELQYEMNATVDRMSISFLQFAFRVAKDYQGIGTHTPDQNKLAAARDAVEFARFIVDEYKNHSDYDKLKGYAEKICFHAAYDHDAVNNGKRYGDSWQIVNVFDGVTATNVVCEGYAKAFKYLCDLTDFDGDVKCYTVSGTMTGGTGAGAHMWNVVTYNGKNYLVDVTNCDSGTIGNGLKLFMRGAPSSDGGRSYNVSVGGSNIKYVYDESQKDLLVNGYLVLDSKDAEGCAHSNIKTVSAKASTCTEQGWKEYKKCEDCGVLYNQNGTVTTKIPYLALAEHTPTQVKAEEYLLSKGNCAKPSLYFESCEKCKKALDETFEGDKTDHDIVEAWFVENGYHFYRCSVCSYKENYGKCSGGSATCTSQAKCDTCKMPYGDFAPHTFGSWKTDSATHWKECSCFQKTDIGQHTDKNTDGKCDSCSYSMTVASEPPKDESKPPVEESKPPIADESKPPIAESEMESNIESIAPPETSENSVADESEPEKSEAESVPPEFSIAESIAESEDESEQTMSQESSSDTSVSKENIQDFNPKVIIVIAASILVLAGVVIFIIKKRK